MLRQTVNRWWMLYEKKVTLQMIYIRIRQCNSRDCADFFVYGYICFKI